MTDSLFTDDGLWIIGAETSHSLRADSFPPDPASFEDESTGRVYWPWLPSVNLDSMDDHHPGSRQLIYDLKVALHDEWTMDGGWTAVCTSPDFKAMLCRPCAHVKDQELVKVCQNFVSDLVGWAMFNERHAAEGRAILREYGVTGPDSLESFPYDPERLSDEEMTGWHKKLRQSYLHWIIRNAVAKERAERAIMLWTEVAYKAVREWLGTLHA